MSAAMTPCPHCDNGECAACKPVSTIAITRKEALIIQNLLDYLNSQIESCIECHCVEGEDLDSVEQWRLGRDLRIRRRSEDLLIRLDRALTC